MDVSASGATKWPCAGYYRSSVMAKPIAQTTSALICPMHRTRPRAVTSSWWCLSWSLLWYCTQCDRHRSAGGTTCIKHCHRQMADPATTELRRRLTDKSWRWYFYRFIPKCVGISYCFLCVNCDSLVLQRKRNVYWYLGWGPH